MELLPTPRSGRALQNRSSEILEEVLEIVRELLRLLARLRVFFEVLHVVLVLQVRDPRCRNLLRLNLVEVDALEPLVLSDRVSILRVAGEDKIGTR